MEEKELNLCELLKGCDGEEFYSLMHGIVRFMTISADGFVMFDSPESISVYDNGKYDLSAEVIIFPSRALYEKYPLDAYSAWMEWKESRKPKRWIPQIGERIFWVNANLTISQDRFNDYETQMKRRAVGNEFKTGKEARQAAEDVRACLMKFHDNQTKQW